MSSLQESKPASNKTSVPTKRDKFVPFLVAFAILALIGIGIGIYLYWHSTTQKEISESYFTLPEKVVDSETQMVRIKVAIQVESKDRGWVQKNNAKINQIFSESIQNVDSNDFHNRAGCEAIQEKIKDDINQQMQVDKIQAVLYQDLLTQAK
jgi:flagellar basal body-associated protein FliL